MPVLHFSTHIEGPCETIFTLIADLTRYDRWLPRSRTFGSVSQISNTPVGLGTRYVDIGSSGTMQGLVTAYEPPTHIAFQQTMPVKLLLLTGDLDIHIGYTLEQEGQVTCVVRDVSFHLPIVLKVAQPIIVATVRRESKRLLILMKRYVEKQPENDR